MKDSPIPPAQQIQALLLTHCETLKRQIAEVERLSAHLAGDGADQDTLNTLIQIAHRIAGTGGTMGFDAISHKAFALETFAKQLLRRRQGDGVSVVRALAHSLAKAGTNLTPQQSRLRQKLLMRG